MNDSSAMLKTDSPDSNESDERLWIDDEDRYSRLRLIGWWDQSRIRSANILVVGAGALGNEVLKNLALLGLGQIHVIDLDTVQESNLSRSVLFRESDSGKPKSMVAARRIQELNSDCQIFPIQGDVLADIGLGLVREMDLVICCVDNREARLWINRMCWKTSTPWIDGGIQEINGVVKVFMPPDGACYECAMTDNDYRLISLRYSCPLLKQEDIQQGKVPTAPTIASMIGGLQVQEALKLLHELPAATGSALVFNGAANNFYQTRYPRRDDCLSHETYEPIVESPLTHHSTVKELFSEIEKNHGVAASGLRLVLDRDFLVKLSCFNCQTETEIHRPMCQVNSREGVCNSCQQPMAPESICEIDANSPQVDQTLRSLGIPDHDIVKVAGESDDYFLMLVKSGESRAEALERRDESGERRGKC